MADIMDVQQELAALCSAAVYPNGTSEASVTGFPVVVYPGWPMPDQLDIDMRSNKVNVSVWARGEVQNTTRFPAAWQELSRVEQTLTATVSGDSVTIGGNIGPGQVAVVIECNGLGYAYGVKSSDTLQTIASALADMVPGATAQGAVISLASPAKLVAKVAVTGTIAKEVRRETDKVQIVIWAPSFELRTTVARAINAALAELRFIPLPDGFSARIVYQGNISKDKDENSLIYRRDFIYSVEYPTTVAAATTEIASTPFSLTPHLE